jgi:hypothetical protein
MDGANVFGRLATALYIVGLIGILLALSSGSRTLSASVLVLAGTLGDIRVARMRMPPRGASRIRARLGALQRTLRQIAWQTVVLAFVLLDIGGLGFALVEPVWLAPWVTINLTALALGTLSWSEHRRLRRESAVEQERQAEKVRATERRSLEEHQPQPQPEPACVPQAEQAAEAGQAGPQEQDGREANGQHETEQVERLRQAEQQLREAEQRLREEQEEREARRLQEAEQAQRLREAEQQLREAEQQRQRERDEREAQRQQQAEQAQRLRQAEEQLRKAEQRLREEREEREAQRQQQAEQARRLRQAEQQLKESERRRRRAEEEREGQRDAGGDRERPSIPSQTDWWSVLGVAPSASKDEIARNYRRKIQQCHPDRVAGLAPEFVELAEERTKVLNVAYEHAMRVRG